MKDTCERDLIESDGTAECYTTPRWLVLFLCASAVLLVYVTLYVAGVVPWKLSPYFKDTYNGHERLLLIGVLAGLLAGCLIVLWVLARAQVVLRAEGIWVCYPVRSTMIPWREIKGIAIPCRGLGCFVQTNDRKYELPTFVASGKISLSQGLPRYVEARSIAVAVRHVRTTWAAKRDNV